MNKSESCSGKIPRGPSIKAQFFVNDKEISEVRLSLSKPDAPFEWQIVSHDVAPRLAEVIARWVECYCKKRQPDVLLPIAIPGLPPYTTRVLYILHDVPFGVTLTYKELAEVSGTPQGARATGSACGRNPCPLIIPCHRVLASKGIGGFSAGLEIKKALLDFEGIAY
jgi:methylated-DNA-[protein]-cysteine S-methyltransferase